MKEHPREGRSHVKNGRAFSLITQPIGANLECLQEVIPFLDDDDVTVLFAIIAIAHKLY